MKRVSGFVCLLSRRCLSHLVVLALAMFVSGLHPRVLFAQSGVDNPGGVFQLEGNATKDASICFPSLATPSPGCPSGSTLVTFGANTDDWANLNTSLGGGHALASTGLIVDLTNTTSDNIFTGGGSKDINDFGSWLWKSGKPQGKDDIAHAFAAAYTLPNGDTAIYFGMDRFDNSGDATAGFWFVQDSTFGLNPDGTFSGHHVDGDLLIVSDFSTGGAVSTINVFRWVGGASGSLVLDASRSPAPCDPTMGNSTLCAIVNPVDGVTAPWSFTDKGGSSSFGHGEFLEGALDLNAIFGANVPCFTTFFSETRSSTSPTATLSDLTPPASFPLCSMNVTKSCGGTTISSDGTSVTARYTGSVTNTGIGSLFDITVTDTLPDGTTQNIVVVGPSTTPNVLAPHASAPIPYPNFVATTANVRNPLDLINTATAKAASREGGPLNIQFPVPPNMPATAECRTSPSAAVTITKACDTAHGGATLVVQNGLVVVEVFFTANVCNNTSPGSGEALENITLADTPTATLSQSTIPSLAPGACAAISGHYFPSTIDQSGVPGRFLFTDTIRVTGATGALGVPVRPVAGCPSTNDLACAPVSCPICPAGVCQ